ncbi:S4 domain protein [Aphelenchoides fujianensis]|nr:S4 domain protein [Aphelenchoides fujianensis]
MVRKLKHHEQKLLKKVDFIDWKDNNLQENKILARFSIRKREEYTYYNKLSRQLRELAARLKEMPDKNPNKKVFSDFVTWAPGSKVRRHVRQYNNEHDDFDE